MSNPIVPQALAAAWDRASRRERRIASAGAIVVAIAIAWGLLWQPLRSDIQRTQEERVRIAALLAHTRGSFDEGAGLARAAPALSSLPSNALKSAIYADGAWTTELGAVDGPALTRVDRELTSAGVAALQAKTAGGYRMRLSLAL